MNLETSEFETMLELNIFNFWNGINDFDEVFIFVEVKIKLFNLFGSKFGVERSRKSRCDTLKPSCNMGYKSYLYSIFVSVVWGEFGKLISSFTFVDMIRK